MFKSILTLGLSMLLGIQVSNAKGNRFLAQNDDHNEMSHAADYGKNFVRFNPLNAMVNSAGIGLSYERILDKGGRVGLILPVSFMFENTGMPNGVNQNVNYQKFVFFNPGLKIYPFGQHKVTYAVGPSVFFGFGGGDKSVNIFNSQTGIYAPVMVSTNIFRFGMLINNYVNFQIATSFSLGLSLGLGVKYIDHETQEAPYFSNEINLPLDGALHLGVGIGYRF